MGLLMDSATKGITSSSAAWQMATLQTVTVVYMLKMVLFIMCRRLVLPLKVLANIFDAIGLADDLCEPNPKTVVDHNNLTFAKQLLVYKDIHGFTGSFF